MCQFLQMVFTENANPHGQTVLDDPTGWYDAQPSLRRTPHRSFSMSSVIATWAHTSVVLAKKSVISREIPSKRKITRLPIENSDIAALSDGRADPLTTPERACTPC